MGVEEQEEQLTRQLAGAPREVAARGMLPSSCLRVAQALGEVVSTRPRGVVFTEDGGLRGAQRLDEAQWPSQLDVMLALYVVEQLPDPLQTLCADACALVRQALAGDGADEALLLEEAARPPLLGMVSGLAIHDVEHNRAPSTRAELLQLYDQLTTRYGATPNPAQREQWAQLTELIGALIRRHREVGECAHGHEEEAAQGQLVRAELLYTALEHRRGLLGYHAHRGLTSLAGLRSAALAILVVELGMVAPDAFWGGWFAYALEQVWLCEHA